MKTAVPVGTAIRADIGAGRGEASNLMRFVEPGSPHAPSAEDHRQSGKMPQSLSKSQMTSPSLKSQHTFTSGTHDRVVATRAWAYGWAISRGTQTPIERSGYFQIFVGRPEQTTRYVLPHLDRGLVHELVSTEAGPGSWLKVCAPIESVSPLLSIHWNVHEPEFLMSADLVGGHPPAIDGYRMHTDAAGALTFAKLIADTGEVAASGQVAMDGSFATFDQIVTAETHRRKGLGRHIMAALSNLSLDRGAKQGVLVATGAGAALYKALGWSMVSPVTAASLSRCVANIDLSTIPVQNFDGKAM